MDRAAWQGLAVTVIVVIDASTSDRLSKANAWVGGRRRVTPVVSERLGLVDSGLP